MMKGKHNTVLLWLLVIAAVCTVRMPVSVCMAQETAPAADTETTVFTEEDEAAYRKLPAKMTTKYADEVSRLYEKLQNASNKEDYPGALAGLRQKKEEIDEIKKTINDIEITIAMQVKDENVRKTLSAQDAMSLQAYIETLSEYDRGQVEGYDEVKALAKELAGKERGVVIKALIIIAVIVALLYSFLTVRIAVRRKKRAASEEGYTGRRDPFRFG